MRRNASPFLRTALAVARPSHSVGIVERWTKPAAFLYLRVMGQVRPRRLPDRDGLRIVGAVS